MQYIKTEIEGLYVLEPRVFKDARGYFLETWNEKDFNAHVSDTHFIQDNESKSSYGVLRGKKKKKGEAAAVCATRFCARISRLERNGSICL